MTKENKIIKPELTLGELGIEAVFSKSCQNQTKMFGMLFISFGINEDVINVNDDKIIEIIHENRVHEPHEGSWSIGEAKGHDGILI